jgi:S1-C subfamily serine protease
MGMARQALFFVAFLIAMATSGAASVVENTNGPENLHVEILSADVIRGSGFFVDRGLLVTSAHVLVDARPGAAVVLRRPDGATATGRVAGVSRRFDVAAIVAPEGFRPVAAQPVRAAAPRMAVAAAGSRRGVMAVSEGTVSAAAVHVAPYGPGFVAAMPGVGPGFSGGPVVDAEGALVGMVAAYRRSLRSAAGGISGGGSAFAPVDASGAAVMDRQTEAFVLHADVVVSEARRLRSGGD